MGLNIDENIIAFLALVGSAASGALTWLLNRQKVAGEHKVADAQVALEAYDKLCEDLTARLDHHRADIDRLEAALAAMKEQHAADRAAWQRERAELEARIMALQAENAELKRRLDALQGDS